METINSREIDSKLCFSIASSILKSIDGMPMQSSLSCLLGITVALAQLAKDTKQAGELSDEDGLEKLIFSWLSALDVPTGMKFSKYISTDCIDIDIDFNDL